MIGTLIGLIITVIIAGAIYWAAQQLLALVPLAEPFATIVRVLMVLLMVIIVIYFVVMLLGMAGVHVPVFR